MTTFDRKIQNHGICEVIVTRHRSHLKLRNRIYASLPDGDIIGFQYINNKKQK